MFGISSKDSLLTHNSLNMFIFFFLKSNLKEFSLIIVSFLGKNTSKSSSGIHYHLIHNKFRLYNHKNYLLLFNKLKELFKGRSSVIYIMCGLKWIIIILRFNQANFFDCIKTKSFFYSLFKDWYCKKLLLLMLISVLY